MSQVQQIFVINSTVGTRKTRERERRGWKKKLKWRYGDDNPSFLEKFKEHFHRNTFMGDLYFSRNARVLCVAAFKIYPLPSTMGPFKTRVRYLRFSDKVTLTTRVPVGVLNASYLLVVICYKNKWEMSFSHLKKQAYQAKQDNFFTSLIFSHKRKIFYFFLFDLRMSRMEICLKVSCPRKEIQRNSDDIRIQPSGSKLLFPFIPLHQCL